MQSPCIREASQACCHGCCPNPFLSPPEPQNSTPKPISNGTTSRYDFTAATASSLYPNTQFTDHESLPSLAQSFSNFNKAFPQYSQTNRADQIRAQEYYHLNLSDYICLDYIGHGLFSYSQQQSHYSTPPIASSSHSPGAKIPFFNVSYKFVNLNSQILYGGRESEFESKIWERIMSFMNISEDDYSMVFTANQSSAFKILADSYPFQFNKNLLTVYDYENEAVEAMIEGSKKKGARVMSAEFSWPNMRIQSRKLRKMIVSKRKKRNKGLFVLPLQSKMTGVRYSYQWMSMAQENGWHILLDASALGAKNMETLGLSLFQPDFLICSFFNIFGENPSGFGCLFVKKSSASLLNDSTTSTGIVSLMPARKPSQFLEQEIEEVELDKPLDATQSTNIEPIGSWTSEIEFRGFDHADSLGLILISSRVRCLINWLVNALMSLQHPHSETGIPLVRIYGSKIRFDRGPAVAFNLYDWKGEKINPTLVQKLADRNKISICYGILQHIWFSDKHDEERERLPEAKSPEKEVISGNKKREGIPVITASLGFLTNFEDTYRLWAFVSRFLDADFVEKERWRYTALNQTAVEV